MQIAVVVENFKVTLISEGGVEKLWALSAFFFFAIYVRSLTIISLGRILVVQHKLRHILLSKNNYDKLCHCTTGETFVTRKITRAVAKIHLGLQDEVNSTCSDKNWGVASLMLHPLPNKILGNDMRNDGPYLAYTWKSYGWLTHTLEMVWCWILQISVAMENVWSESCCFVWI